jgi:hypothetical protein
MRNLRQSPNRSAGKIDKEEEKDDGNFASSGDEGSSKAIMKLQKFGVAIEKCGF